jgi:hypothetical protein
MPFPSILYLRFLDLHVMHGVLFFHCSMGASRVTMYPNRRFWVPTSTAPNHTTLQYLVPNMIRCRFDFF